MAAFKSFLLCVLAAAAGPSACDALFFKDPILIPSVECILKVGMSSLGLLFGSDPLDLYLRDDSTSELAQTGQYFGPEGITEYGMFASSGVAPFIKNGTSDKQVIEHVSYRGYEDGHCMFLVIFNYKLTLDPYYTNSNATVRGESMFKVYFDFRQNYISRINIFFSDALIHSTFANFLNTDQMRQFVCDTMKGPTCAGLIDSPPPDDCAAALKALPAVEERSHIDGNTQGCRMLHSVFAATNGHHCPHLSFTPMVDVNGIIKCQTKRGVEPEDLFTPDEIGLFFEIEKAIGIDPTTGIKILDPSIPPGACGLFGLGIFCSNGCGWFGQLFGLCVTS